MKTKENIKTFISGTVDSVVPHILDAAAEEIDSLNNSSIQLTGGVTSAATPIGDAGVDVTVEATVDPTKHKHTISTITDGVEPTPNSIGVRNTTGDIKSNGTDWSNTGYLLANGSDLSSVIIAANATNIEVVTDDMNSSTGQNVIVNLTLEKVGKYLKLHRTYGWVCNCNYSWYCRCCC